MSKLKCPKCKSENTIMCEYPYGHPDRYDGVSEFNCLEPNCYTRWGRWTGKILEPGEFEPRYGGNQDE